MAKNDTAEAIRREATTNRRAEDQGQGLGGWLKDKFTTSVAETAEQQARQFARQIEKGEVRVEKAVAVEPAQSRKPASASSTSQAPREEKPSQTRADLPRNTTSDPAVEAFQKDLSALGYKNIDGTPLKIDGLAGKNTNAAFQKFAQDYSIDLTNPNSVATAIQLAKEKHEIAMRQDPTKPDALRAPVDMNDLKAGLKAQGESLTGEEAAPYQDAESKLTNYQALATKIVHDPKVVQALDIKGPINPDELGQRLLAKSQESDQSSQWSKEDREGFARQAQELGAAKAETAEALQKLDGNYGAGKFKDVVQNGTFITKDVNDRPAMAAPSLKLPTLDDVGEKLAGLDSQKNARRITPEQAQIHQANHDFKDLKESLADVDTTKLDPSKGDLAAQLKAREEQLAVHGSPRHARAPLTAEQRELGDVRQAQQSLQKFQKEIGDVKGDVVKDGRIAAINLTETAQANGYDNKGGPQDGGTAGVPQNQTQPQAPAQDQFKLSLNTYEVSLTR